MATALFKDMKNYPLIASVMVIDDQLTSRIILESILKSIGNNITVRSFDNALSALHVAEHQPPDLIIADYKMPELDGVEFTRRLRALPGCADIPVVIITIIDEKSVLYEALEAGATDFLTKPIDHYECKVRCRNLLTMRRQQLIIRNRANSMETQINEAIRQVQERERSSLQLLASLGTLKDGMHGIPTHCPGRIAAIIARAIGMDGEFCETIETAALLYDIGKAGIPDEILLKQGSLDENEMAVMKTHTTLGYELMRDFESPSLRMAATISLYHHENFEGKGYPHGLRGEDIPVPARIVALTDTFLALIRKRPYREARSMDDAIKEIQALKGTRLDPRCVEAFFLHIEQIIACIKEQPGSQANSY